MRLAIDIRTLYTFKSRGLGSALMMTLEGLKRDTGDHEYLLLVDKFNYANSTAELISGHFPQLGDILRDPRFKITQIPRFASVLGSYEHTWEQIRLWRGLDLPPRTLYYSYNYLAPLLAGIPFAVHVPDTFVKVLPHHHTTEQKRILAWGGLCVREAGLVTTESENSQRDITRFYHVPKNRIAVVHEAVNDVYHVISDEAKQSARRELGLPERFMVCVGVLEPRKNILNAVRALKIYNDRHEEKLHIVVVGEVGRFMGKLYTEVTDEILRLDLRRYVMIAGFLGIDSLNKIYNCAELLLFPSIYEGFGLPPLEAMLCGTPSVVSNTSSLPEVTAGASEYIDPNDPESIAGGIEKIVRDPANRAALVEKGFAVAEMYSLENRTKRLINALAGYYNKVFP